MSERVPYDESHNGPLYKWMTGIVATAAVGHIIVSALSPSGSVAEMEKNKECDNALLDTITVYEGSQFEATSMTGGKTCTPVYDRTNGQHITELNKGETFAACRLPGSVNEIGFSVSSGMFDVQEGIIKISVNVLPLLPPDMPNC